MPYHTCLLKYGIVVLWPKLRTISSKALAKLYIVCTEKKDMYTQIVTKKFVQKNVSDNASYATLCPRTFESGFHLYLFRLRFCVHCILENVGTWLHHKRIREDSVRQLYTKIHIKSARASHIAKKTFRLTSFMCAY